ncbi:MAG: hypothetical protein WCZ20_01345 [Hydrogenophaga sp.]|nr:hypothetical protein [Ottowia sp.]
MTDLAGTFMTPIAHAVRRALMPSRWQLYALLIAAGAAAMGGATWWHAAQVQRVKADAYAAGQAEVQGRWNKATQDAKDGQERLNADATAGYETGKAEAETVYVYRTKEITKYVPHPDTHCPADADFVRLFNDAGGAARAAGGAAHQ